jgi:hypothetical protein
MIDLDVCAERVGAIAEGNFGKVNGATTGKTSLFATRAGVSLRRVCARNAWAGRAGRSAALLITILGRASGSKTADFSFCLFERRLRAL